MTGHEWRRVFGIVAIASGAFVIVSEIPFWATRSSLAPVLTALAVGVIAGTLASGFWRSDSR